MIIEPERSGKTISDVCIAFGISRETWYKWKRRYNAYGIDGLKDQSRKPHNVKNVKVTEGLEKLVLELRLNNRFGPMRIRFRLKRKYGVSLGTKTIYNILKIHKLNVLSVKLKRKYKRMDIGRIRLNRKKQKEGIHALKTVFDNNRNLKPIFAGAAISGLFCDIL